MPAQNVEEDEDRQRDLAAQIGQEPVISANLPSRSDTDETARALRAIREYLSGGCESPTKPGEQQIEETPCKNITSGQPYREMHDHSAFQSTEISKVPTTSKYDVSPQLVD